MADSSDILLSSTELHEQLTSGLKNLSATEAHEEFSERLDSFLDQNNIDESEIISGESEYASILSEAAFNGLDFRGMEGTGLSLSDARRIIQDGDYRLEMAEDYLTGNAEDRIEREYGDPVYEPYSLPGTADMLMGGTLAYEAKIPTSYELTSSEGLKALEEAVKIKEFMHYEMRDALNSGPDGAPEKLEDFEKSRTRDEWTPMLGDQAALHQNGGADDLKFIHEDGRELVYDFDTKELMTDDKYMGTYNYVNATIPTDETPGPLEVIGNILTKDSLQHKDLDVEPWVELGNTRADRYANGGEEARDALLKGSAVEAGVKSLGNIGDFQEKAEVVSDAKDWVSDKADQAGDAISDAVKGIGSSLGLGSWQKGALNPSHQNMNEAHIQRASVSETALPTDSGTVSLEDAIAMLAADQKTLNTSSTGEQASSVQDALNHPDAAQMFQNLQTHGVKTLTAEVAPDMSPEDRVSELLLAGQEATQEAGIPMPEEQRQLEATREHNNSYEGDNSLSM